MRLILPISDQEKQTLMQNAGRALQLGRLHAVREESQADGTLAVSAKFTDSFGFVDHPRLTTRQPGGELVDFRCNCADFRKAGRLCCHCMALADTYFDEISTFHAAVQAEAPMEAPAVPLVLHDAPAQPSIEQISYRFCNCRQDLYPGEDFPLIPQHRYYQMFGENAMARELFHFRTGWCGSCFGITTTATMFLLPRDPISTSDFQDGAIYPADLKLTSESKELEITLHNFLERMQILQYGSSLISRPRSERLRDPGCLDELCTRVLNFQKTKTAPVLMAVWRSPKFDGGHSVFPYRLETNDNGQDRLLIYDPNHPMKTRYAYLEKDAAGHYTSWRFPMNDQEVYASATGGQLTFDAYADYKEAWDKRHDANPDATMFVPRKVAIADTEGNILFRVTEDGCESFCDDIYQVLGVGMADDLFEKVQLSLPAGTYWIRNEDPQRRSYRVRLSHVKQSVSICVASAPMAPDVMLTADDSSMTVSAHFAQDNCACDIVLDAIHEHGHYCYCPVDLTGHIDNGGLTFGCYDSVLRCQGNFNKEKIFISFDGVREEDLSCIEFVENEPAQSTNSLHLCSDCASDAPASDTTD